MEKKQLLAKAIRMLAMREHSCVELKEKLMQKCQDDAAGIMEQVDVIIDELKANDYLNETRFVESQVRYRVNKGQGPNRIRAELSRHQLDESELGMAFESLGIDWREQMLKVKQKKFGDQSDSDPRARLKIKRFLHYRGFDTHLINTLWNE